MRELNRMGMIPGDPTIHRRLVAPLVDSSEEVKAILRRSLTDVIRRSVGGVFEDLEGMGIDLQASAPYDAITRSLLEKSFEASEDTMRRIRGDVMGNLSKSYEEGLGIEDARERLKQEFTNLSTHRAETIARTEIQSAQNDAAHETMEALGVQYEQWWTAMDERVRGNDPDDLADHTILHGVITRTGDNFPNGLRHPGDRDGPIEEWINCRCRSVPFIMPEGMMAPVGVDHFTEADLVAAD